MAAGGGGSIVHISSIDGLLAGAYINVPYSVAKGGLATLTRLMAVHHGREGIRVNCLAPGHVHASFTAEFAEGERERRRKIGPLGTAVGWLDVTGLSDPAQRVIAGTRTAQELVLRGLFDDKTVEGPDAVLSGVVGQVVTVSYGPAGSATGQRRITAEFLCLSYRVTSRTGDKVRFEARFLQDGAATLGLWQ